MDGWLPSQTVRELLVTFRNVPLTKEFALGMASWCGRTNSDTFLHVPPGFLLLNRFSMIPEAEEHEGDDCRLVLSFLERRHRRWDVVGFGRLPGMYPPADLASVLSRVGLNVPSDIAMPPGYRSARGGNTLPEIIMAQRGTACNNASTSRD